MPIGALNHTHVQYWYYVILDDRKHYYELFYSFSSYVFLMEIVSYAAEGLLLNCPQYYFEFYMYIFIYTYKGWQCQSYWSIFFCLKYMVVMVVLCNVYWPSTLWLYESLPDDFVYYECMCSCKVTQWLVCVYILSCVCMHVLCMHVSMFAFVCMCDIILGTL